MEICETILTDLSFSLFFIKPVPDELALQNPDRLWYALYKNTVRRSSNPIFMFRGALMRRA
jgi:hypothetical protein